MSKNINSNPDSKKLLFDVGNIVRYVHPSFSMIKIYGLRIYTAKIDETEPVKHSERSTTPPDDKSTGMVVGEYFNTKHGAGTQYYKVLLADKLFWIAQEHLEKI